MEVKQLGNNQIELQIQELEKLLNQSIIGFHHLFERERITEILKTPTEELDFFNIENMELIQKLFTELIKKETIQEKQAFIERLSQQDFEILLRTYFHIVDSTIISAGPTKH